jgi:C-terminal processing protease CtpA/Prc
MSPFGTSASVAGDSVEQRQYNDYYGKVNNGWSSSHLIQSPQSKRDEMLEIYAPPGLLGVVIDTPGGGSPVVHAIKDTCPIRKKIYVGDKLVAVDDIDVRRMNAIDVSRLISKKSGQAKRKLTVIRSARGRDGIY